MDIVSSFNPPRLCELAGRPYWVRALTVADYACLLAWLDDIIPGHDDRKTPPAFGSEQARAAMDSLNGRARLIWLALRDQDVTWGMAREMALEVTIVEWIVFTRILDARRRTLRAPEHAGEDLGESWWGPGLARLAEEYRFGPDVVGRMTLDQLECYVSGGLEREDPRRVTHEELQRLHELAEANAARAQANGDGVSHA